MAGVLDALGQFVGVPVAAGDRLETDLGLDSLELATLAATLRDRFGDRVDLSDYLAGLELDQLIELTAGQLAAFVAERTRE
ncbi:MAG TPA: acyl carrier protein [Jatrophihabitans sp.]|nr:acyl carrier protein [Jatrophihabitans sp.]